MSKLQMTRKGLIAMAATVVTGLGIAAANAQSTSTITQNGKTTTHTVGPGESQTIRRNSGGNSSVVTQSTGRAAAADDIEMRKIILDMHKSVPPGPFRKFLEDMIKSN